MIGYVKGTITHMFKEYCFVDVHGVGYRVYAPVSTLAQLTLGREALLFTYLSVREDAMILYGFLTQDEYDVFMLLLGVNGVGPKVALGILSAASPDGFRLAVQQKNVKALTKMPGIGKKTAERILVELHDKLGVAPVGTVGSADGLGTAVPQGMAAEALAALLELGFTEQELTPVIDEQAPRCADVSELIKNVLKVLGSGR